MQSSAFLEGFLAVAKHAPDRRAVIVDDQVILFSEALARARTVADRFLAQGLRSGQRVSFYAENSVDGIVTAMGALFANATFTSMHHSFSTGRLARKLADCGAAFLITDRADRLGAADLGFSLAFRDHGTQVLVRECDTAAPSPDLGAIFYTSGSSGEPKGVAMRTEAMLAAVSAVSGYLRIGSADVVMSFATLGSDFGFYNCFIPLNAGATVMMERQPPDGSGALFDRMARYGVTGLHVFPTVLHDIVSAAGPMTQYPDLRYICSTGQAFPIGLLASLRRIFPKAQILSSYGMTECKRIAYLPDDELDAAAGSIGRPLQGLRAYLLDSNGEVLTGADRTGELTLAGGQLMDGYWNDPAATKKTMLYNVFGEAKVLRTGDIFRRDEMGRYWFVGRRDEVFTRRGFQVDPREIERVALSVPSIRDALVVAIPHPVDGHLPGLAVSGLIDPDGWHRVEAALRHACGQQLETHMQPHRYLWLDSLPRAASGKVCRATVLERFLNIQDNEA
jgi:long-chain acyl-CoA synthetase